MSVGLTRTLPIRGAPKERRPFRAAFLMILVCGIIVVTLWRISTPPPRGGAAPRPVPDAVDPPARVIADPVIVAAPEAAPAADAGASEAPASRPKRTPALPPRPALLGDQVRYLSAHCRARAPCAGDVTRRYASFEHLSFEKIRHLRDDVTGCLDVCGAPAAKRAD